MKKKYCDADLLVVYFQMPDIVTRSLGDENTDEFEVPENPQGGT